MREYQVGLGGHSLRHAVTIKPTREGNSKQGYRWEYRLVIINKHMLCLYEKYAQLRPKKTNVLLQLTSTVTNPNFITSAPFVNYTLQ